MRDRRLAEVRSEQGRHRILVVDRRGLDHLDAGHEPTSPTVTPTVAAGELASCTTAA